MKIRVIACLGILVSFLFGCKNADENIEPVLLVSPSAASVSYEGGTASLKISMNGKQWQATSDQTWCVLSVATSGLAESTVTVTVATNTTNSDRTANIAVTMDGKMTTKVVVSQQANAILEVSPVAATIAGEGGTAEVFIKMNGKKWEAVSGQSWCKLSGTIGTEAESKVTVTLDANTQLTGRTATLVFTLDGKKNVTIYIQQAGKNLPDYSEPIAADPTGMNSTAKQLAGKMVAGWNLGNTLEATGGETGWGNPVTTQSLIDAVKATGINAIRIPCAWMSHLSDVASCKVDPAWLARVKEVVDYCYKNDMYVILNAHWDGGWLENNPTKAMQEIVNKKQKALWQQIAAYFRNYDEHLLFAGTNEVHVDGEPAVENFTAQMSYNQTFVDAVRSTGGKNAYRVLVVQSYNTNIDLAVKNLVVSKDNVENKLMVEVHYYDPWDFCGLEADTSWGTVKYYWGADYARYGAVSTWGQEDYLQAQFQKMKTNFVDKGYPVILGEFGAMRRYNITGDALTHHLEARAFYYKTIGEQAKKNGMIPFLWDAGIWRKNDMGVIDRSNNTVYDTQALNAFLDGATNVSYPF